MITDAVLWVSHPAMMLERLGGMTVLERQLFTLARAGITRVWVAAQKPRGGGLEKLRMPAGLQTFWVDMVGDSPSECKPPYLGMSGDHVVRVDALRQILSQQHSKPISFQDESGRGVVQVIARRTDGFVPHEKVPMPPGSCHVLQNPPDLGPALPWLLKSAVKSSDGFMARVFDRHVSLAVTRRLLNTSVTPNFMTLLSTALGLCGAALMTDGHRPFMVGGALLVWLHTLLDGCDGEMARLKFLESRWGGILDF
ncbi:MAG TPA: CDP-alcohol phosphatidyltransferase family protein, partial [Elusimicrobiota bacterium]|nr:CDP-alcohol phosphatidyltransferase family protein [Elusimicrobiota bacterium]